MLLSKKLQFVLNLHLLKFDTFSHLAYQTETTQRDWKDYQPNYLLMRGITICSNFQKEKRDGSQHFQKQHPFRMPSLRVFLRLNFCWAATNRRWHSENSFGPEINSQVSQLDSSEMRHPKPQYTLEKMVQSQCILGKSEKH